MSLRGTRIYQTNRINICISIWRTTLIAGRLPMCISNTCHASHNYVFDYNRCGITCNYAGLQISIWIILTIFGIHFEFAVQRLQTVWHRHCIPQIGRRDIGFQKCVSSKCCILYFSLKFHQRLLYDTAKGQWIFINL